MQKFLCQLDALIPFAPILRRIRHVGISGLYSDIFTSALPLTLLYFAISAQIPRVGILVYALGFIPLAALHHNLVNNVKKVENRAHVFLWYYAVILVGAGSLWFAISYALAHLYMFAAINLTLGIIGLTTLKTRRFTPWAALTYAIYHLAALTTPLDAILPVLLLLLLGIGYVWPRWRA